MDYRAQEQAIQTAAANYRETDMVEKESPLSRELNIMSKATSELLTEIESLEVRLMPVLQAQPKLASTGTPEEQMTQIPSEIRRYRQAIDNANYMLRSILSRLEL